MNTQKPFDIRVNPCSSVATFLSQAEAVLATLEAALALPLTDISRDSAILRFVYSFEAIWKAAQLCPAQGEESGSPAGVFRGWFESGLVDAPEMDEWLTMATDRYLAVRTYDEELAQELYGRLAGHAQLMRRWLELVKPGD